MPWWTGAVFNYIREVRSKYVILKARVVNGVLLEKWKHDFVDHNIRTNLLEQGYWENRPFTMLVFCPFDTTKAGLDRYT